MANILDHKCGDTFEYIMWFEDGNEKMALDGLVITAQARLADETLIQTFDILIDLTAKTFKLFASWLETENWPEQTLQVDVRAFDPAGSDPNGTVKTTGTFRIKVLKRVTLP